MAWTDLKAAVAAVIRTNGNQEITGALLQSTLNSIIDQVGANATFKGVATPATTPGTPDGPLFYIAYEKGIYANFNAINITEEDGLVIILYSSNWNKINIPLALKDELVQARSDLNLLPSNGVYYAKRFHANESNNISESFTSNPIKLKSGDWLVIIYKNVSIISDSGAIAPYFRSSADEHFAPLLHDNTEDGIYKIQMTNDIDIISIGLNKSIPTLTYSIDLEYYVADAALNKLSSYETAENKQDIAELRQSIIGESITETFVATTNSVKYNLIDGTSEPDGTGSYTTGTIAIPAWVEMINVKFPSAHTSFGVLLYNNETFVTSYTSSIDLIIDLSTLSTVNKIVIQAYKTWGNVEYSMYVQGELEKINTNVSNLIEKTKDIVYTDITVVRNPSDYNSIRETINSITDADYYNRYIVHVPNGEWRECDIQGKKYVKLIGQDSTKTILYNDGTDAIRLTPSDYSYSAYSNMILSNIPQSYKHCFFAKNDMGVENLTVKVNDCKYCAHIDDRGYDNVHFKNCHFISLANVSYPVGIGVTSGQKLLFDNCRFTRNSLNNFQYAGFFLHNYAGQSSGSEAVFNNCLFDRCAYALIDELGSGQTDVVEIINSESNYCGIIEFMAEGIADLTLLPYSIQVNMTGSNLNGVLIRRYSNGFQRPNAYKYINSNYFKFITDNSYTVGQVIRGYISNMSIILNVNAPIIGVIQYISDGIAYLSRGIMRIESILITNPSVGALLYDNNGALTTIANGEPIGYIDKTMYTGYHDILIS